MLLPHWLFEADITERWGQHWLTEGQSVEHLAFEELRDLTIPPLIREVLQQHHTENPPLNRLLSPKK